MLALSGTAWASAWDFNLPLLDGSRFVRASAISGPVLLNFWSADCPPCVAELPRLQAFALAHPQWTVLLVSTDSPAVAREFLATRALSLPVLRPGADVRALMRGAGNRHGILPFSVTLQAGQICQRHLGELHEADLPRLVSACKVAS